jgi:hypothetical protein
MLSFPVTICHNEFLAYILKKLDEKGFVEVETRK